MKRCQVNKEEYVSYEERFKLAEGDLSEEQREFHLKLNSNIEKGSMKKMPNITFGLINRIRPTSADVEVLSLKRREK
jgi:hypothetical protein